MIWKCLIVDDEAIARKLLIEYVSKIPELQLVGSCATALEAMNYIRNDTIDILFLDIQMPHLTGIDFLKVLPSKVSTILTTAYTDYAVQSYEMNVTDYLLKPIEFDRFYKAVSKATGIVRPAGTGEGPGGEEALANILFVKADKKIVKVNLADVIVINGQGAYVEIITEEKQKIMSLMSMSKLESTLPRSFFRTHRSHIVNINKITSIVGNTIYLGNQEVVMSKNKREEFFKLIDQNNLLT